MKDTPKRKKKRKITYKLYASRSTEALLNRLTDLRFTRITADYTLIYASNSKIMRNVFEGIQYTIIEDGETHRLSAADKEWLMNCNFTIIAEEAVRNKELVLQNMNDALQALETELEKTKNAEDISTDGEEK